MRGQCVGKTDGVPGGQGLQSKMQKPQRYYHVSGAHDTLDLIRAGKLEFLFELIVVNYYNNLKMIFFVNIKNTVIYIYE